MSSGRTTLETVNQTPAKKTKQKHPFRLLNSTYPVWGVSTKLLKTSHSSHYRLSNSQTCETPKKNQKMHRRREVDEWKKKYINKDRDTLVWVSGCDHFLTAWVFFTTTCACATCKFANISFFMLNKRREGVHQCRPMDGITETCHTRHNCSKSHLRACEKKQLGAPDGPVRGCSLQNCQLQSFCEVSFRPVALCLHRIPLKKSGETPAGGQHSGCVGGCEVTLTSAATPHFKHLKFIFFKHIWISCQSDRQLFASAHISTLIFGTQLSEFLSL